MTSFLKIIGKVIATEAAIRSVTAIVLRLLIGYFAGLPPEAISFDASIAFFFTLILEFPTGVIADIFGYRKCISLGCYFQACAVIFVLLSILSFQHGFTHWMWIFLAAEAVFDAVGNTLISGAREALLQNAVDEQTNCLEQSEALAVRSSYLSLAEGYSRWVPLIGTASMVLLMVISEHLFGTGIFLLPFIALGWIYTERVYRSLYALEKKDHSEGPRVKFSFRAMLQDFVGVFEKHNSRLVLVSGVLCGSIFYNVLIQINLFITLLRRHIFFGSEHVLLETGTITALILLGRILRSYLLPWGSKKMRATSLLALGVFTSLLWGIGLVASTLLSGELSISITLALLVLIADIPVGWMVRPTQMLVLEMVPSNIRATFMSFISAIVFLLHTVLAIILTRLHIGVPSIWQLGWIAISVSIFCCLLMLLWSQQKELIHEGAHVPE